MINTKCAICGTENNSIELYKQNFSLNEIDEKTFSARRLPDKIHYRIVRCKACKLVRSDPAMNAEQIEHFYEKSSFNYKDELNNISKTYSEYLKRALRHVNSRESILEIGCGNGFFLEAVLKLGFEKVYGVEPSKDAVNKSTSIIKNHIVNNVFKPNLFKKSSFDMICMFQVFDHLEKPNEVLRECRRLLKKKGIIIAINHDFNSTFSKILKDSCPIIDVEHTYFYDKNTMKQIYEKNNFKVIEVFNVKNIYTIKYWMMLFPFSKQIKLKLLKAIDFFGLSKSTLSLNAGNIGIIAKKY